MENIVDCLAKVTQALDARDLRPGALAHVVAQLETAMEARVQGETVRLERAIQTTVQSPKGVPIEIDRVIDVVTQGILGRLHTEIKTGRTIASAFNVEQMTQDAVLSIKRGVSNVWEFTNIQLNNRSLPELRQRIENIANDLLSKGFSAEQVQRAIERFQFEDKVGDAFAPAITYTWSPDGPIAKVALEKASHSPDFNPAMEVLFGPSGKVADAATGAAQGANLEPALDGLEEKIEEGVESAMDQAGDAVSAHGAQALGAKISEGATALGNVLTAVPQLYASVTALGDAWNKPLESTQDYMTLFSAAGSAINQGVQTFQALASVTKIASAAQAVFNAVMAMNPIVLIVIAVIALIAAIAALIYYWDEVKATVRDNPWLPLFAVILGPIGILIALVVAIAAHWEEVKLAVLEAANFISIQVQRIGAFFVGVYRVAGQVWDAIVATAVNAGIGIANAFIGVGTEIQNFFIGVINGILSMYNEVAESAIGELVGLQKAELIPEVDVQTRLIPPREVPQIDVAAAFDTGPIRGGLEDLVAEQQTAVANARAEDERRRAEAAAQPEAPTAPAAPAAAPGLPAPGGLPALVPEGLARPALPAAAAGAPGVAPVDSSVTVNGGITVNISAERLEADAAQLLSDEIVAQLQARLGALRSEQDFRTGVRS